MLRRCRDVVNNNDKQLIMVFDDADITALLGFAAAHEKKKIDDYLEDRLKEILT